MKKITLILVFTVLFIAVVAGAVIGVWYVVDKETASTPTPTPTVNVTPFPPPTCEPGVICVTAEQLCDDYDVNEVAADHKYKGNIIEVSSIVDGLGRDILNKNKAFLRMNCGWITDVWCYFDEAFESQLVPVEEGDLVSVRGECMGKNVIKRIVLDHCTLVESLTSE